MNPDLESVGVVLLSRGFLAMNPRFLKRPTRLSRVTPRPEQQDRKYSQPSWLKTGVIGFISQETTLPR